MGQAPPLRALSSRLSALGSRLKPEQSPRAESREPRAEGQAPSAAPPDAAPSSGRRSAPWYLIVYLTIVYIALTEVLLAGVVVGVFSCVPIVLMSMQDDERHIWAAGLLATLGFALAATLGVRRGPEAVSLLNQGIVLLAIVASCVGAVVLQRRRRELAAAHADAAATRDTNRLLLSLLAHDLRAPLVLASEGIAYVEGAVADHRPVDVALLGDVGTRLRRSLRSLEAVLAVARADAETAHGEGGRLSPAHRTTARLRDEIAAEVAAFAPEAAGRRKRIALDVDALPDRDYVVDVLVVRQALGILVDNALRYARPGAVLVTAALDGDALVLVVADRGPQPEPEGSSHARDRGLGLGLRLCHGLCRHAGGSLTVGQDEDGGTVATVRLPLGEA